MKNINLLLLSLPLLAIFASCITRQYPVTSTYEETAYRTEYISETYTENETTVETLSGQYELTPLYTWYSQNITFNGTSNVNYAAYDIPPTPAYDNIRLKVSIWKQLQYEAASIRILDMTRAGHLSNPTPLPTGEEEGEGLFPWTWITSAGSGTAWYWLDIANKQMAQALFIGGRASYLWAKQENPQVIELNAGSAQKIGLIICGPQNPWNARVTMEATWSQDNLTVRPITRERKIEKQVPYTVQKQKTTYQERQVPFWEAVFSP